MASGTHPWYIFMNYTIRIVFLRYFEGVQELSKLHFKRLIDEFDVKKGKFQEPLILRAEYTMLKKLGSGRKTLFPTVVKGREEITAC